jgi:hypothetical protein
MRTRQRLARRARGVVVGAEEVALQHDPDVLG